MNEDCDKQQVLIHGFLSPHFYGVIGTEMRIIFTALLSPKNTRAM